jgi:ABC-2 type transport system permease protein
MLLPASGIFHLSFLSYGLMILPYILILFLFGIALGVIGCSIVLRFGPAAEWFIWPIPAFISPFVGVFYPLSTLPAWMRAIAHILPPSYVFEGLRKIVAGGMVTADDLVWAILLTLLYMAIACLIFTRVYKHAVRTGLIARYSAETLS